MKFNRKAILKMWARELKRFYLREALQKQSQSPAKLIRKPLPKV